MVFERMQLWLDGVKRPGPEAMAVDEWLLETATLPVLRVYGWLGDWGSIGYFGQLAAAAAMFPAVEWVRRWTGGGTVDHRADWTYSVVAPGGEDLARQRGAESYRLIHAGLAEALRDEGVDARLSTGSETTGALACFANPVHHDLIDESARKIAGAGQRRTSRGLLHQGSVARACGPEISRDRACRLVAKLAGDWETVELAPPAELIADKVAARYGAPTWRERR